MQTEAETGEGMYGFVGCTVKQYMTRTVLTVKRQTTMRELTALFEKYDFNAFPVVEEGKLLGIISIRFPSRLRVHHQSSCAPLQRIDESVCSRSDD
jgi:CBS-domain-containing membrane protein